MRLGDGAAVKTTSHLALGCQMYGRMGNAFLPNEGIQQAATVTLGNMQVPRYLGLFQIFWGALLRTPLTFGSLMQLSILGGSAVLPPVTFQSQERGGSQVRSA